MQWLGKTYNDSNSYSWLFILLLLGEFLQNGFCLEGHKVLEQR